MSETLVIYDRMCSAITECIRVDEAKDIRDKSLALACYYRQARNEEAERGALNIRLRASRRIGQLLKEMTRAETPNPEGIGGRGHKVVMSNGGTQQSPYAQALTDNDISRQQAGRFQALADVPEDEFEAALVGPDIHAMIDSDADEVSPTSIATALCKKYAHDRLEPHIHYAALEHFKQLARQVLRGRLDPSSTESDAYEGELFSGHLQERYPLPPRPGQEPMYKKRELLTDEEAMWNIQALQRAADALAMHSRALLAWFESRFVPA